MKDDKTISASEINRYIFCNYQWYYERKYGSSELRRLRKEHMEELGIAESKQKSPIQRGLAFHANYESNRRLRLAWAWFRAAAIIAISIYMLLYFGMVVL